MKLLLILSIILLSQQVYSEYTPNDFEGGFFQFTDITPKLYEVEIFDDPTYGLQGNNLMAFGDYNGDTYTDFITLHYENEKGYIDLYYYADDEEKQFAKKNVCGDSKPCGDGILNIYPVDINYDGKLDILVLFQTTLNQEEYRQILPLIQNSNKDFSVGEFNLQDIQMSVNSEPFLANIKNSYADKNKKFQRKSQIIYEDLEGKRMVIDIQDKGNNTLVAEKYPFENFISKKCTADKDKIKPFAVPNYNAVLDVNGDCIADMILTTQDGDNTNIEIWLYQPSDGEYCLDQSLTIDQSQYKFKGISYADFNFDGAVDFILLFDDNNGNTVLQIVENTLSVKTDKLCTAGSYSFPTMNEKQVYQTLEGFSLPAGLNDESKDEFVTSQLRFGDVNQDGYNDLILVLQSKDTKYPLPFILLNNYPKENEIQFLIQDGDKDEYTFTNLFTGNDANRKFIQATFFDINENGVLDMFLNYQDGETEGYKMLAVYNYRKTQNYFLKTLGLNGQCKNENCLSALYYGATFMCKVTVGDNSNKPGRGVQLSQSAYSPLQLPFTIIGLGRTNNYIENLSVGYPQISDEKNPAFFQWQTIIPNSQLIIYPYGDKASNWTISIFIQPTKAVIVVIIVTATILVLLGLAIIYCHIKEKEEDKKNQESLYQIFR